MTTIGHNSLGDSIEASKNALVSKLHEVYKVGKTTDEQARIDTYNIGSHTATWYFNKYLLERASESVITTVSFADAHAVVRSLIGYDELVKSDKANRSETFEQRVRRGVRQGYTVFMTQVENYRLEKKDIVPAYDEDGQPIWKLDKNGKKIMQEMVNAAGKKEKRPIQESVPYERRFAEYSFDHNPFVLDENGKEKTTDNGEKIPNKNYRSVMLPECVLVPEKKNEQGVTFKNLDRTPVKATQAAFNGQAKVDFPDAFATAKSGKRTPRTPDTGALGSEVKLSTAEKIQHGIAALDSLRHVLTGEKTGTSKNFSALSVEQLELIQAAILVVQACEPVSEQASYNALNEMIGSFRKGKEAKETIPETK